MPHLPAPLVDEVLVALGLDGPPARDREGLGSLYRHWCRSVPFDNTLKLIALHGGSTGPLPGMDAEAFLRHWLGHGTGGTCWPSNNALHELATAFGFPSRLVAASMMDSGVASHGTCVVTIEGADWLIDSSMLTDDPLRLSVDSTTTIDHGVFTTSAEPVAEGWLFRFSLPYAVATMPCRTIAPTAVSHEFCVERFESSREMSPFNLQPSTRRNDDEGVVSYGGGKRYRRTVGGVAESDLVGDDLYEALHDEFGFSEEIVARLASVLPEPGPAPER